MRNVRELEIRPAKRTDISALVECAVTSIGEPDEPGFGKPPAERVFNSVERLTAAWVDPNFAGTEEVIIAEAGGRLVAFVTLEERGDDLELINIAVRGDSQGRGIGTAVVGHVERQAGLRGKGAVTLGTSRNAAGTPWRSYPWWLRRGYVVTGEEENAWTRAVGPGVREIRMRKAIPR